PASLSPASGSSKISLTLALTWPTPAAPHCPSSAPRRATGPPSSASGASSPRIRESAPPCAPSVSSACSPPLPGSPTASAKMSPRVRTRNPGDNQTRFNSPLRLKIFAKLNCSDSSPSWPCGTLPAIYAEAKELSMSSAVTTQVTDLQNYVNGAWRRSAATEYFDVTNPATAELLARTPLSTSADVDAAVQAAADAFPAWRRTPPGERVQYLFKLKNLLEENLDDLARVITLENGKTFSEARAELRRAIENVEVACGIPMMMQGYNLEDVTPGVDEMQIRQPLGVVAAIVPFNFPAMVSYWFLPYAIACGNTFILKPSERVPLSMHRAFELLEKT